MEPFATACEYGCPIAEYGEGGCLRCRHGLRFL
jgi:hypothetical protein